MAIYTFTGLLACSYLGCCGATVTWQTMAAKAVPTALGALFAMALNTLCFPAYASNAMLAQQAGILRGTFRQLCRRVRDCCVLGVGWVPAAGCQRRGLWVQRTEPEWCGKQASRPAGGQRRPNWLPRTPPAPRSP